MFQGSSLFNVVLGMAASLLALSILIQILQEFYKFLFKSKSAAYKKVLLDMLGSQARFLWEAAETADYRVRGPLDIFRRKPGGVLLPLGKEQLSEALTRAAPGWVTRLLEQIEQEKEGESGDAPSSTWKAFLERLGDTDKGAPGYWTAREIAGLLRDFGHGWSEKEDRVGEISAAKPVDMNILEKAVRRKFLPQVEKVNRDFNLIEANLDYANRRRSLRQTFLLGLVVALVMSFPVQQIYDRAVSMTDEQLMTMTAEVMEFYQAREEITKSGEDRDAEALKQDLENINRIIAMLNGRLEESAPEDPYAKPKTEKSSSTSDSTAVFTTSRWADLIQVPILERAFWEQPAEEWLYYLLGCIVTAVLLGFGAPFWNDIAKSVLNYKRSMAPATGEAARQAPRSSA